MDGIDTVEISQIEDMIKNQKVEISRGIGKDLMIVDSMYTNSTLMSKEKKIYQDVILNGRYTRTGMILETQHPMAVPPMLRNTIDYVFIFDGDGAEVKLYEMYGGKVPTFSVFKKILKNVCEGFQCLVIDRGSNSDKLQDAIFWYKADMSDYA